MAATFSKETVAGQVIVYRSEQITQKTACSSKRYDEQISELDARIAQLQADRARLVTERDACMAIGG